MTNEVNVIAGHWEWGSSIVISIIGVFISYRAYKYAKQANGDTNQLIKDKYENALKLVNQKNMKEVEERLIEAAMSEYRRKGQANTFLLGEYERLASQGWTKEQFGEIYRTVGLRSKGREFKRPLFE